MHNGHYFKAEMEKKKKTKQNGNFKKKMAVFTFYPNLIKMKKFKEQLNILKSDYDGHFFAQRYVDSQSLHRKKILPFFVPKWLKECNTFFRNENWKSIFTKLAY